MEDTTKNQAKSLLLKGFNKNEIAKILNINVNELQDINCAVDIKQNTFDLYSELQKDLSKLVFTEMNKDTRDNQVILNAIKLQTDLQEKKFLIISEKSNITKISKNYIYQRDEEIAELKKTLTEEQIAEKLKISVLSVKQALDRYNLNLSEELKTLSPSIISETIGLQQETRLKILENAYKNSHTRKDIREIVNNLKNER